MAGIRNSLQLRTAQTQTLQMTPQLQQAIRLLQLSSIELEQEIQQVLETNPFLEKVSTESNNESLEEMVEKEQSEYENSIDFNPMSDDYFANNSSDNMIENDHYSDANYNPFNEEQNRGKENLKEEIQQQNPNEKVAELSNLDSNFQNDNHIDKSKKGLAVDNDDIFEGETVETITDHLMFQLDMSPLVGADRNIAINIIDAVNDSGYLTESLEDILSSVQYDYPDVAIADVKTVLKLVQHYDTLGVASRNAAECMLIQLNALTDEEPYKKLAIEIIRDYSDSLSNRDFRTICQKLSIKEDTLKQVMVLLKKLNPRPGNFAPAKKTDFIVPDVVVYKDKNGEFHIELNSNNHTIIKINESYSQLVNKAKTVQEKEFFNSHLQEAKWFINSLDKRNDTLLKVSKCIVKHQKDFMNEGPSAMKPMVLNDVAEEIEMHESTISRITTEKYMYTPQGTFELKYFFSSSVGTDDGGTASATAVKSYIKELISKENPRKPLSDSRLSELLMEKGMNVARRTVAKYREALGIESSSQRKKLV